MKKMIWVLSAVLFSLSVSALASADQLGCETPRTGSPIFRVTFNASSNGQVTAAVVRAAPGMPAYGTWFFNCQNVAAGGPYSLAVYQCAETSKTVAEDIHFGLALKPDFSARKQFAEITDAGGVISTVWCR